MENILRNRSISAFFSILLRIPPIFLMDTICNSKRCFSLDGWLVITKFAKFVFYLPVYLKTKGFMEHLPFLQLEDAVCFAGQISGLLIALILIVQKTRHLIAFYLSVAALGLIVWSYILNVEFVKYCSDLLLEHSSLQHELFTLNKKALQIFFCNYMSQSFLSIVFCFSTMNLLNFNRKKLLVGMLFIFPTLVNAALPSTVLTISAGIFAFGIFSILLWHFVVHILNLPNNLWINAMTWSFSFSFNEVLHSIFLRWTEFQITHVLQIYAVIRFFKNIMFLIYDSIIFPEYNVRNFNLSIEKVCHISKQITVMSFENIIAICGSSAILSVIVDKYIFVTVQKFLIISEVEQESISLMFSQLLVSLSVQLGITIIEPEKRCEVLSNMSWMIGIGVFSQITLQICKQLTSLSIASYKKHIRMLVSASLTLVISAFWLMIISKSYLFEPWLFPVIVFNIENILRLLISLIIYVLNIIHDKSSSVWYELNDYIFYLESTKNTAALIFAVLVCIRGFYHFFEFGSVLRILFISIHFYHNVWCQLVLGWNHWKKRKLIYSCVNFLPIATAEEVRDMGGLCAICLNEVNKHIVCITRCNHFFHTYCLRKWLNEQQTCPICHRIVLPNTPFQSRGRNRFNEHQD